MSTRIINVDYLSRVEGETAIQVQIPERNTPDIKLKIFEPPRFFEGFLIGRHYTEVGDIVSRICGICPVSHMTTAIRAVEKAMGIEPSPQTKALRRVACSAQIAASHLVHLYALTMPDYLGCQSFPDMIPIMKEDLRRLLRLRKVVNDLTALIGGGRALHSIGTVPGGFTRIPTLDKLNEIKDRLIWVQSEARAIAETIASLKYPDFRRDHDYLALSVEDSYAFNRGKVISMGGLECEEDDYVKIIEEVQVPYAMAKRLRLRNGGGPMVGSLARLHHNFERLSPSVQELAESIGFKKPDMNPFHNNLAQAIEIAQCLNICVEELEKLNPIDEEPAKPTTFGKGSAITEAPRGLLFHSYEINRKGVVENARIITPTVHNFVSIEEDLRALVEQKYQSDDTQLRLLCEILVRAYDPCFSCSVH